MLSVPENTDATLLSTELQSATGMSTVKRGEGLSEPRLQRQLYVSDVPIAKR